MKNLLILGAGAAGTMVANKLRPHLPTNTWQITIVDQDEIHYYQPGFLFIPFGIYDKQDVVKAKSRFIPNDIEMVISEIHRVDADANNVILSDGRILPYDYLIIATGTHPCPDETPGLPEAQWRRSAYDFYTYHGSTNLAHKLQNWQGGKLVVNIMEMPIKCPVAPLEFAFLADWFFTKKGLRDKVDITYVTPLPSAFTNPSSFACSTHPSTNSSPPTTSYSQKWPTSKCSYNTATP